MWTFCNDTTSLTLEYKNYTRSMKEYSGKLMMDKVTKDQTKKWVYSH